MLEPTPLQPGQSYATVADIRDCDDLSRMPITPGIKRKDTGAWEPFWTKPDGSPLTIEIRALSFTERREINAATKDDDDEFVLQTCLKGIAQPRFSREQLTEIIATKHPLALDQISEHIWWLSNLPAGLVRGMVRERAGLPPVPPQSAPGS